MAYRRRLISVLAALFLLVALIGVSTYSHGDSGSGSGSLFSGKTTLNLWYTDDELTTYLRDAAVAYNEEQNKYRVEPRLIDDAAYFDDVYEASKEDNDLPDLFILTNDALERAVMAGLTSEVVDDRMNTTNFAQTALDAVSYKNKLTAYPLCFETAAFLYNTEYLRIMADNAGKSLDDTVPKTIVDIINLSNSFEAPPQVKEIFKWDVSDIFYNYYFAGNYINMGGPCGDDHTQIQLYNKETIQCMKVYQQLNSFFSVDTENDDYADVIRDFANGHIVFTVATSDAANTIREMKEKGEIDLEYGVTKIPDSTADLLTKTMSVTQCVVVNGYSDEQEAAHAFAQFMLFDHMDQFNELSGKTAARKNVYYYDRHMENFYSAYEDSVPITKLREASNFWLLLENTFSNIWSGADANEELRLLAQQLYVQISGKDDVEVQKIADPDPIDISSELTGMD